VSEAGEFVDAALQRESSWERAAGTKEQLGSALSFYGASVGAVRGAIRDASRKFPHLAHDDVTALSSELWAVPVFERRLAAVVLLQSNVRLLDNSDLTRIEGFIRGSGLRALTDPLAVDVVGPLIEALDASARARADVALDRWSREPNVWLRRAALLSPLRALRAGGGDWDRFARYARATLADSEDEAPDREAVFFVLDQIADARPELSLSVR
jgi:hypothetical protein